MGSRKQTRRLPREERKAHFRAVFAAIQAAGQPTCPADFCRRSDIGVDKTTLRRVDKELAEWINEYGWKTMPHKMRPRPGTPPAALPRDNGTERQQARRSKELPKLRRTLAERAAALRTAKARIRDLEAAVAERERLVEVLLARVVTPRNGLAEATEDVLSAFVRLERGTQGG